MKPKNKNTSFIRSQELLYSILCVNGKEAILLKFKGHYNVQHIPNFSMHVNWHVLNVTVLMNAEFSRKKHNSFSRFFFDLRFPVQTFYISL
jgi:hypothetical protein